jgi:hypothetical protein
MTGPKVYAAIVAITADLAKLGIAKERTNQELGYRFRGIDDIYNALSPLLAKHRLCILPRMLERSCVERRSTGGEALFAVTVRAAFAFVSVRDGSSHIVETYGEALDGGDKATAKAMSAAYKYAALQTFCIPTEADHDPDAVTHRVKSGAQLLAPPDQGWPQWAADIQSIVGNCQTDEALTRLQNSNRALLLSLSRADPALYAAIGTSIKARREAFAPASPKQCAA